jgi:hypothetical protein
LERSFLRGGAGRICFDVELGLGVIANLDTGSMLDRVSILKEE